MKVKRESNALIISNQERDLNEVLETLASKDSKLVANFLVEKASLPRELRTNALRLVLNEYVKIAKELVLSDEFMYRLNWYQKFSEYQLINFWNVLVTNNSDKFDEVQEALKYKKTFYLLLLMNAEQVGFSDEELGELLELGTPENSLESFQEFMNESDSAFYDYDFNFDGMSYEDFKSTLKKSCTVADIRNIAAKYDIKVPKRLKKEELVQIVAEGLRRQGKYTETTEAELKKMSAITLQRFAKNNGINASTEMKKADVIEYILNHIESSTKAVRKPRIELATLPELDEFEFSKDYLRDVHMVEEDDADEEVAVAEPEVSVEEVVALETPIEEVVEEVEPVEETVEETPVEEAVEEETAIIEEPAEEYEEIIETIEEITEEYVEVAEGEDDSDVYEEIVEEIIVDETGEPVIEDAALEELVEEEYDEYEELDDEEPTYSPYNDELLAKIVQLLEERDQRDVVNQVLEDNRFNCMVKLYEERIQYLEKIIQDMRSTPIPINIQVTYPTAPAKEEVVQVSVPQETLVTEELVEEETQEEAPVEEALAPLEVVEEAPIIEEEPDSETTPIVLDSTFDGLSNEEKGAVVRDEMRDVEHVDIEPDYDKLNKKQQRRMKKLEKRQRKIDAIRRRNELTVYRRNRRKSFWNFIKGLIIIAIILFLAVLTCGILVDRGIITGTIAEYIDKYFAYVPPFGKDGIIRATVGGWVQAAIDFISGLFSK